MIVGHSLPSIRISILNWNSIDKTLVCLSSLQQALVSGEFNVCLRVTDNGSDQNECEAVKARFPSAQVTRSERNQGFAPGHNRVIQEAIDAGDDYVWVLNNDTEISQGVLEELIRVLESDPVCAAVSPVLLEPQDAQGRQIVDFLGSYHDEVTLQSVRLKDAASAKAAELDRPFDMWVAGTAVLYRVSALRQIGGFDHVYFAYFEDNDLGLRLAKAGWTSRMAYAVSLIHHAHDDMFSDRPPYYFYLMTRNSFLFWLKHSPPADRRRRRRRLFARGMWTARCLHEKGFPDKRDACLLGVVDGWRGRGGPVRLGSAPARWMIALAARFPYKFYLLFDGPSG